MTVNDLAAMPGVESLYLADGAAVVETGYTSDLLSDVMARAPRHSVLITIQAHRNTVAVGALAGVVAIVICNRREIPEEMVSMAREEGISVMRTLSHQFDMSWRVHACLVGA